MTSTDLVVDFRRTLDRLKWAPKVWQPENTGMRKVQSDPCFTSTCTKLPAVLQGSRPLAIGNRGPPPKQIRSLSPSRRLLAGTSTRVGFHNDESKGSMTKLPNVDAQEQVVMSHKSRRSYGQPPLQDVHDRSKTFEHAVDEVKVSITRIHSSLDDFEGLSRYRSQYRRKTTTRASNVDAQRHDAHHAHSNAAEDMDDEHGQDEDARRRRMLKYRYVRKIEPPAPPLQRLPPLERAADDGKSVIHNTSLQCVYAFSPRSRQRDLAERGEKRNQRFEEARTRRVEQDKRHEEKFLLKMRQYEERTALLEKNKDESGLAVPVDHSSPDRMKQARKWQATLVMIGFHQMAVKVVSRYREIQAQFNEWVSAEKLYGQGGRRDSLAHCQSRFIMAGQFVNVARSPANDVKTQWLIHQDWRTPPKQQVPWRVRIPQRKGGGGDLIVMSRREVRKERFKSSDNESQAQKCIYVEVPDLQELRNLQQNAVILEALLTAKFRRARMRKRADKVVTAMSHWNPDNPVKKPIVAMMAYLRRVKQIQRFIRWALKNCAKVRFRLDAEWHRLESSIIPHRRNPTTSHQEADEAHDANGEEHIHDQPHQMERSTTQRSLPRQRTVVKFHDQVSENSPSHGEGETSGELRRHMRKSLTMPDQIMQAVSKTHARHLSWDTKRGNTEESMDSSNTNHERRKSQALSREERRRRNFLTQELTRRRKKYLPLYEVWLGDMELYRRDVLVWRAHRKDCRKRGVKPSMPMPERPPRPSYLPTEEELLELVRQGIGNTLKRENEAQKKAKLTSSPSGRVGRVGRLAILAGHDSSAKKIKKEEEDFKATETSGGEVLCEEVAGILAPSSSHPIPVASESVERPMLPSPV